MPSARVNAAGTRVYLPLMRVGMCLDCEACFEIDSGACPACSSRTWMPLARFLENARRRRLVLPVDSLKAPHSATARVFVVVAHDREALYQHFKSAFAGHTTVQIVRDRRRGERRATPRADHARDRRRRDARWQAIDEQLRVLGWAVIRTERS